MSFNDALSDMLARIKNAHKARKSFTSCYKSKLNLNVLTVLKDEGYILIGLYNKIDRVRTIFRRLIYKLFGVLKASEPWIVLKKILLLKYLIH